MCVKNAKRAARLLLVPGPRLTASSGADAHTGTYAGPHAAAARVSEAQRSPRWRWAVDRTSCRGLLVAEVHRSGERSDERGVAGALLLPVCTVGRRAGEEPLAPQQEAVLCRVRTAHDIPMYPHHRTVPGSAKDTGCDG
jgi:hypothetical protein